MAAYQRVKVVNQALIPAPPAKVWGMLTDWARTKMRAATPPGAPPPPASTSSLGIIGVELDGQEDAVPRTRVLRFQDGRVMRETLLHQDDATMHIYYNIEGVGPFGIRNYLATTEVDPLGDRLAQVTITARFDLGPEDDAVAAKAFIDTAHVNGVFAGMKRFLT